MKAPLALALLTAGRLATAAQPSELIMPVSLSLDSLAKTSAQTLCVTAGTSLPVGFNLTLHDPGISNQIAFDVSLTRAASGVGALSVSDVGQATNFVATPTHIAATGSVFDLQLALDSLSFRSAQAEDDVLDMSLCRPADGYTPEASCATVRAYLVVVANSSAISTALCRAPPTLDPADDLGDLPGDGVTPVLAPRLQVASDAPQVTWYRDGMAVQSTLTLGGVATFRYPPVASYGLHSYAVGHDAAIGPPYGAAVSAPRYLYQHEWLHRADFEAKTVIDP